MTKRQQNKPDYSFLIETFTDSGERLLMWRIDQRVVNPGHHQKVEALTNAVERYLHSLYLRTGLNYSCFAQGPIDEIDKTIHSLSLEIH